MTIQVLRGDVGRNHLIATTQSWVYGEGDSDTIVGSAGDDSIDADNAEQSTGDGNDTVDGGAGDDYIRLLGGNDTGTGGAGNDDINGNKGADIVYGGAGADTVRGGQGADKVYGEADDDPHVNGNIGNDTVYGGDGNDTCFGGQDDDIVYGNAGDDSLSGDLGHDTLHGGSGNDTLQGGPGNDIFIIQKSPEGVGNDRIIGFVLGEDKVRFDPALGWTAHNRGTYTEVITISGGQVTGHLIIDAVGLSLSTGDFLPF